MEYAKLNTGAEMPILGFGVYGIEDTSVILSAFDAGYRSLDTASGYFNEDVVGRAVRESGLKREDVFVTTKLTTGAMRENRVQAEFEQSLSKLGMDYVDMYIIHWPVKEKYVEAWLELEKIYKSGRAKAVGLSNFQDYHITEIKKVWSVVPAINQIELHPFLTQKPLLELCKAEGIVPEAWSPLGGGGSAADIKDNLLTHPTLAEIGKKYSKSTAQVILRWNIDLGIITIPKSTNPERIKANINIFDFSLTPDEIAQIDALNKNLRTGPNPDNFSF